MLHSKPTLVCVHFLDHFLPFYSMVNKFQKKKEDATEVVEDPEGNITIYLSLMYAS